MLQNNTNSVIRRKAELLVEKYLEPGKVVVLYGPRRAGKTTLLRQLEAKLKNSEKILFVSGEDVATHRPLSSSRAVVLTQFVGTATLLIVDEAQMIPNIGRNLKLLVDTRPDLKIIASGSASFDLAQKVGEPLTGRKWTVWLYPLSASELAAHTNAFELTSQLPSLLVYGSYPEAWQRSDIRQKQAYLQNLVDSYLYKDILMLDEVRNNKIIRDLLQLLAYQIGHEVSLTALGTNLEIDKNTVARYLDLLEQSFVIFNIRGFSRNLRKEITKKSRYYFYDNGVRNALINNFNEWNNRNDRGQLWENWLAIERIKHQNYSGTYANNYFWRTYDQKEIDWIEERGGKLYGYEFSWQEKKIKRATANEFLAAYPGSELQLITPENYLEFVS